MALTRSALVKRHKAIAPQEKQPMLIVLVGAGLVKFVIRNGEKLRVSSRELVPGDLVLLNSGDKVPADVQTNIPLSG